MNRTTEVRLSKLGTVMIGVSDMDRSLAFYRDALGLPLRLATAEFALLAILALAPPARADFGAAARDSLAIPALTSPALSAFT